MARNYVFSKLPVHRSLFGDAERVYEMKCNASSLKDLHIALRSILSHGKYEPLSQFEEDVLCDIYNSISLINLK